MKDYITIIDIGGSDTVYHIASKREATLCSNSLVGSSFLWTVITDISLYDNICEECKNINHKNTLHNGKRQQY